MITNRYYKLVEIEKSLFNTIDTPQGSFISTNNIKGLESRCLVSKEGGHFWVFLPNRDIVECLACKKKVIISLPKPPEKTELLPKNTGEFATPPAPTKEPGT